MKKKPHIGLTIHNFENEQTYSLLKELLNNNVKLDFIIYHQKYFKRKLLVLILTLLRKRSPEKRSVLKKIKNIKTYNIPDINSEKAQNIFNYYKSALIICNTGIIKKKTISQNPDIFFLNTHDSNLPKYRGVSNLDWALWDSEDIYVTVHRINNGIDEGDILYQENILKNPRNSTLKEIIHTIEKSTPQITCKAIIKYINGEISFTKQDHIGEPLMQYYSMHHVLKDVLYSKYIKS